MKTNNEIIKSHIVDILKIYTRQPTSIEVNEYKDFFSILIFDEPIVWCVIERVEKAGYEFQYAALSGCKLYGIFHIQKEIKQ